MTWHQVTKADPCPICERDHWCTVHSETGAVRCTRVESNKKSVGSDGHVAWIHGGDSAGGWLASGMRMPMKHGVAREDQVPATKLTSADIEKLATGFYHHPHGSVGRIELSKRLGVTVQSLMRLRVGFGSDKGGPFSSWPTRKWNGEFAGIVRRYGDGTKKTMYRTSNAGLFIPTGCFADSTLHFLEGGSDTCAALDMGLDAIGRPSNSGGVPELIKYLDTRRNVERVIVWGENDYRECKSCNCGPVDHCMACWPGYHGSLHCVYQLENHFRLKIRIVWAMPMGKDFREMIKYEGASEFIRSLS